MNNSTKEIERYREYLSETELSESTKSIYVRRAGVFLDFLGAGTVTKKEVITYKKYLMDQKYARSTVNLYIVAVNNFLKYAGYRELLIRTEKLPKPGCPEDVLDRKEYWKMLEYARESGRVKYYCIMRTLALTGIRVSELSDCTVEALERGKFMTRNKGKTREVFLPDKLVKELYEYCAMEGISAGVIFRGSTGGAIRRTSVYRMLVHLADLTGISQKRVHPHSFRHLFAITYMEQYSNLFELADILGHSSLETTRIYTATTSEAKRKKLDQLGL